MSFHTVSGCHAIQIYIVILLLLRSCSVKNDKCRPVPKVAQWIGQSGTGGETPAPPGADAAAGGVIFFVSAGFDAMADDGFGTQHLNVAWYRWFVLVLRKEFPRAPMVFNPEGGYNPTNVADGMRQILAALSVPEGSAEWERTYYS